MAAGPLLSGAAGKQRYVTAHRACSPKPVRDHAIGCFLTRDAGCGMEHAPELNAAGILHLGVHGSVARGDASPSSDVDLIAEFDQARRLSLIGRVHLENRLTDILGVECDPKCWKERSGSRLLFRPSPQT